jgi:hypothetical protein
MVEGGVERRRACFDLGAAGSEDTAVYVQFMEMKRCNPGFHHWKVARFAGLS